jgi:hypothetical protein
MRTTLTAEERFAIAQKNHLRFSWRKTAGGHTIKVESFDPAYGIRRKGEYYCPDGKGNSEKFIQNLRKLHEHDNRPICI